MKSNFAANLSRRRFLGQSALAGALVATPGLFAEMLTSTPRQTEGPFYPDRLPLDTDNDLLIINDTITPAVGEVTHLTGRILDHRGDPVRNAEVEIWQCDHHGHYLHSRGGNRRTELSRDSNFQGFGRFVTGLNGEYYFRTIKPTPYPGRTPHIHYAINKGGRRLLTTQCYIKGHELNEGDGLLRRIGNAKAFQSVMVDWKPMEDSPIGEHTAHFDVVLGQTPEAA